MEPRPRWRQGRPADLAGRPALCLDLDRSLIEPEGPGRLGAGFNEAIARYEVRFSGGAGQITIDTVWEAPGASADRAHPYLLRFEEALDEGECFLGDLSPATVDGERHGAWLKDITTTGKRYPNGLAAVNAFFPCLGNHDYSDATPAPETYLTYFDLPGTGFSNTSGNERYYDFVEGPIHFFVLNSNEAEPDGTTSTSRQAQWLKAQVAASTSTWNIVYDHYPPYSSDLVHGSDKNLQWPYAAWGAGVVLSGHAHVYERITRDGIVYFVNGLGGAPRYPFALPVTGSQVRYDDDWGAQKVTVSADALIFEFFSAGGRLIDTYAVPARR